MARMNPAPEDEAVSSWVTIDADGRRNGVHEGASVMPMMNEPNESPDRTTVDDVTTDRRAVLTKALTAAGGATAFMSALPGQAAEIPKAEVAKILDRPEAFVDGNILVPVMFSQAVALHPITILLAVILFGSLWGFWGVLLAIPLATFVKTLLDALIAREADAHEALKARRAG